MTAMSERKRSVIWGYFTPVNTDEALCDVCKKKIRHCGNTTNLTKHLKAKHPTEHDEVQLKRAEEVTQPRPPSSGSRQSSLAECFQRGHQHYPGIKWWLDYLNSKSQVTSFLAISYFVQY